MLRSYQVAAALLPSIISSASAIDETSLYSPPAVLVAGQEYNFTWQIVEGVSCSVLLLRGQDSSFDAIGTIATNADWWCAWTVDSSLDTSYNYEFELIQGSTTQDSSPFSITRASMTATVISVVKTGASSTSSAMTTGIPSKKTTSTSASAASSSSRSTLASSESHHASISGAAIGGIVIGAVTALALVVIAALLILRHRRQGEQRPSVAQVDLGPSMPEASSGSHANRHELWGTELERERYEKDGAQVGPQVVQHEMPTEKD